MDSIYNSIFRGVERGLSVRSTYADPL